MSRDDSRRVTDLVSTENLLSTTIANLPVAFSLVDKDGMIVEFNPAAERITGYTRSEVLGRSHLQILHGTSDPQACPFFSHVFENHDRTVETEGTLLRKDGRSVAFAVTSAPIFDNSGAFAGGVEIFRDITVTQRLERERKEILSMFVHDMKNPLMVVHAYIAKLIDKKKVVDEAGERYLAISLNEVARLERLVADFLDLSTVDPTVLDLSSLDPREILRSEVERHIAVAEEKKVTIHLECPETDPGRIRADRLRIERAIENLIGNAIKYNRPGGSVTVRLTDMKDYLLFEVIDTGIGIRKEDLPDVFDAFYRADRTVAGTGLGLAVARRTIEAHGGALSAESVFGEGSTFRFTLPKE